MDVIGIYTAVVPVMVIGQICVGAGSYCILITGYILLGEVCEDNFKQVGMITLNAVCALGEVFIGIFYYWYNEWFNYLIVIQIIPLVGLFLFGSFFLAESQYYYIEKKKDIGKAMETMKHIALINNANLGLLT